MVCSVCGHDMVPLFLSCVCEYCDSRPTTDSYHRGYVVWRGFLGPGFPHYVFSTRQSAERWRRGQGQNAGEIREVLASEPFRWRPSRGTMRDIEFADHLFEIFPDHRFKPAPFRAFLAPLEKSAS